MYLSTLLDLRPLDRVELGSRTAINDMQICSALYRGTTDLPYLFFQRTRSNGRLELRSPGGTTCTVAPSDVVDLVRGHTLVVRAMPRATWMARLRLPPRERQQRPGPECYADAHVLYVEKDRWGRVDRVGVWFIDPRLNDESVFQAPIDDDDRRRVALAAKRTHMPVLGRYGQLSADGGRRQVDEASRQAVQQFVRHALARQDGAAAALAGAGLHGAAPNALAALRRRAASVASAAVAPDPASPLHRVRQPRLF